VNGSAQQYFLDVLSGGRRGPAAAALRAALAAAEPPYAGAMRLRNFLYDRRWLPSHRLPRPAVSIGNLTTGGTGKTPLVAYLAAALRQSGHRPAILLRGYKGRDGISDEQTLLQQANSAVPVRADPDRRRGAAAALAEYPEINLFLLDDAMQHRRVRRDVEIVLINCLDPWGGGHVLPRGLLREPPEGLRRADALVLTHAGQVPAQRRHEIEAAVRKYNSIAEIFYAQHLLTGLRSEEDDTELPLSALDQQPYWVACAIGQPAAFAAALQSHGPRCLGRRFFPDHHDFTEAEVKSVLAEAAAAGASVIVVTEKDWTKLRNLPPANAGRIPFWRAQMTLDFEAGGGARLVELVRGRIAS
jgi:tetraacyldisaccharide 4'-kinase